MYSKSLHYVLCFCLSIGAVSVSSEDFGNVFDFKWGLPENKLGDSQCEKDLFVLHQNVLNMTQWAFEMWDASSRGPSGVLHGSLYQLGNFDECLLGLGAVDSLEEKGLSRQYCLTTVELEPNPKFKPITTYVDKFHYNQSAYDKIFYSGDPIILRRKKIQWAVCAPGSCSRQELQTILQAHFHNISKTTATSSTVLPPSIKITLPPKSCQKGAKPEQYSNGALGFFWLMGIATALVIISSFYHCYLMNQCNNEDTKFPKVVLAFSLVEHLRNLAKQERGGHGLQVLWGLRFFSICMVILDHRVGTFVSGPLLNTEKTEQDYNTFISILVSHGDLMVDSYLVLSGLLSSYLLLNNFKDKTLNIPLLVFYRYVRLVPGYAVVILFTAHVLPITGSGPLWPQLIDVEGEYCRENWWTNIIMLNNYIHVDRMCMVHSWYIPCDFHYFLVSLFMCVLFKMKSKTLTALSVLSILMVAAMLIPGLVTYALRLPGTLLFFNDFLTNPRVHSLFQNIYITSHTRAGPHLLGILTGYLLFRYHKPGIKKLSMMLSIVGVVVSFGVMVGVMASGSVFYEPSHPYSVLESSIYAAVHRSVWALALCVFILSCVFGEVPVIATFLSWGPWVPLGRLVYGAYLVHMGLQIRNTALTRSPKYLDRFSVLTQILGDIGISFAASLILYLTIEAPIRSLINIVLSMKFDKKTKSPSEDTRQSSVEYINKAIDVESNEMNNVSTSVIESFRKTDNIKEELYRKNLSRM